MGEYDSVYESVYECNVQYGHRINSHNTPCPECKADKWRTTWGVKERYASKYNPGEYCLFTCVDCGYSYEEQS